MKPEKMANLSMTSPARNLRPDISSKNLVLPGISEKGKDALGGFFLTDIDVDKPKAVK